MIGKNIRKRIGRILLCCWILFAVIVIKLAFLQLPFNNLLTRKAHESWTRDFPVAMHRGSILDTHGKVMALDTPAVSVIAVPSRIREKEKTAKRLSEILDADYELVLSHISQKVSTRRLIPYGRKITPEQVCQIRKEAMEGIVLVQDSQRVYPYGDFLSQVLGFTGVDNQGLAGLEMQMEPYLAGKNGRVKIGFDGKGQPLSGLEEQMEKGGQGLDVMLTIDATIQTIMERELDNAMLKYHPDNAWGLAMDPNTGEILAMASRPGFDPNHYQEASAEVIDRNLPVWKSYEPGSTFKTVTFAAALEENLFDMEKDTYMDKGYEIVEGVRLKSWKAGGHGLQTYVECLQNSSNPCFVHIASMLKEKRISYYLDKFGFGKKTGIDLPGESAGILFSADRWNELEQATTCFGQGISVTAIQLARAFSALVNGGKLVQPYITKALLHPLTHEILFSNQPVIRDQVISEQTSFKMRAALESVVTVGGAKGAYIDGYRVGGKTGTAQKAVDGRYLKGEYILSTIAAAPIEDPRVVVYMALDAPHAPIQYGGTVVSPIVKKVLEDVLPYMKAAKAQHQKPKKKLWSDPVLIEVQDLTGKSAQHLALPGLKIVKVGEGDKIADQLPGKGAKVHEGSEIWIYCPSETSE